VKGEGHSRYSGRLVDGAAILCTVDKDLAAHPQTDSRVLAAERARSNPNWRVIELDVTHMVNLNDPQVMAEALLSLVEARSLTFRTQEVDHASVHSSPVRQ
jgi:hypothetical protein